MKRIALLTLVLLLCCCAAVAEDIWELPDCGTSPVEVFFREERLWRTLPADTYVTVNGLGTADDYDFFYDSASKTLKMNTVSLVGGINIYAEDARDEDGFPMIAENSLTLELIGDSVIDSESWGHALGHNYMAAFEGELTNLTVTGSGSLRIDARPGLYPASTSRWDADDELNLDHEAVCMSFRSLNMESGTLQLTAEDAEIVSAGMSVMGGDLTVSEGAKIKIDSGDASASMGILVRGALKVNGGAVSASSGDGTFTTGILALETSVSGGSVYAVSGNPVSGGDDSLGEELSALSAALISGKDVALGRGLKLYASREQSGALAAGQMADTPHNIFDGEKLLWAVEKGDDAPARRVLIDTNADIPASGDMSRPFAYLAMVGMALVVMVAATKKRAAVR